MKNIWSILCVNSSIDSQTKLLSMFSCLEEIKLEINKDKISKKDKFVIPVNFQLISFWTIDNYLKDNSTDIKIELIDPMGEILNKFLNNLQAKKGEKRLRSIININGIQVTKKGRYYYRLSQKKNNKYFVVSETPLDIDLLYKTTIKKRNKL